MAGAHLRATEDNDDPTGIVASLAGVVPAGQLPGELAPGQRHPRRPGFQGDQPDQYRSRQSR